MTQTERTGLRRPDWRDESSYPNYMTWTYCHWAWEFLRRNERFQNECYAVESGSLGQQLAVAKRFGLQEFKHFREHFHGGKVPEWLSVLPEVLVRAVDNVKTLRERSIPQGQVVMTFDLDEMLRNRPTLDAQAYNAGYYLNSCLKEYSELKGQKPRSPRPQKAKLFTYLRVLDAVTYAKVNDNGVIAAVLYPGEIGVANHYTGIGKVRNGRAASMRMAESGYLELPAKDYQKIKKTNYS